MGFWYFLLTQLFLGLGVFLFMAPFIFWIFIIRTDMKSLFTWSKWKSIGICAAISWSTALLEIASIVLILTMI